MGRSIYSPSREKITFTNPNWFKVGDEFLIKTNGIIVYYKLRDVKG